MLEIIALLALTRRIGTIVEHKGHSSGGFKLLTVALWIGGELVGAMLGAASMQGYYGESQTSVYVTALLGAAVGAAIAYLIAANLPSKQYASNTLTRPQNTGRTD